MADIFYYTAESISGSMPLPVAPLDMKDGDVLVYYISGYSNFGYHWYKKIDGELKHYFASKSFRGSMGMPGPPGNIGPNGTAGLNDIVFIGVTPLQITGEQPNVVASVWIKPDGTVWQKVNSVWTQI